MRSLVNIILQSLGSGLDSCTSWLEATASYLDPPATEAHSDPTSS